MPQYMLLLYANEADPSEQAQREAELPVWLELNESLQEAGLLVGTGRLRPVDTATTVRVREGKADFTDGPFAVTKEILGGYYLLECRDLDEALKQASRIPLTRYGSVEVRPMMDLDAMIAAHQAGITQA
jgi:hypothetical protein